MKLFTLTGLLLLSPAVAMAGADHEKLTSLLNLTLRHNPEIVAAEQASLAARHRTGGSGWLPDPMIQINHFGSPIETRNGPQTSNIMISQKFPWPSTLNSMESQAAGMAGMQRAHARALALDVAFQTKSLVYQHILIRKKIANKKRILASLENLTGVVLARLKVGKSSQGEVSRVNIERARISQDIRTMGASLTRIRNELIRLAGKGSLPELPAQLQPEWVGLPVDFTPAGISFNDHPMVKMNEEKMARASAAIDLQNSRRWPVLGASATWFRIDEPETMAGEDAGKDAWAVGLSLTLPVWSGKYSSLEDSHVAERSAAQAGLQGARLGLQTKLQSLHDEYLATRDIVGMYRSDILPQANQSLAANRKSYQQGNVPFDRVIDNTMRLIRFENQLEESRTKMATLKAGIEKILGRDFGRSS